MKHEREQSCILSLNKSSQCSQFYTLVSHVQGHLKDRIAARRVKNEKEDTQVRHLRYDAAGTVDY